MTTEPDSARFSPTHTLVVVGSPDGSTEVRVANAGIDAVLAHADDVELWLDLDLIGSYHPDVAESIRSTLDATDDGRFVGSSAAVREALAGLLPLTSVHRFAGLQRLDARTEDCVLCRLVPDHHVWQLDASASPGVVEDVRGALEDEPTVLLPAESLAEWEGADGTHYELSPPSICVDDRGCVGLGTLTGIEVDEEHREIRLEWDEASGLLGRVLALVFPDRPDRLQFASVSRFREVAAALEPLARALERAE